MTGDQWRFKNLNSVLRYDTNPAILRCVLITRSLKVIRCCANRRGIYDFVLALNISLTSLSSTILEISHLVGTSIPHLSSRWNWKKTAWSRRIHFGVRVPRTLNYPTVNLNSRYSALYDHNARPSQTDGRTDEHYGNSAMIRSNKHIAR